MRWSVFLFASSTQRSKVTGQQALLQNTVVLLAPSAQFFQWANSPRNWRKAFLQTVGILWKFLGALTQWHPALAVPRCQLADGRRWHAAWSAGHISCHHGDCLASLSGTVAQCGSLPRLFCLILWLTERALGEASRWHVSLVAGLVNNDRVNSMRLLLHLIQSPVLFRLNCSRLSKQFGLLSQRRLNLSWDVFFSSVTESNLNPLLLWRFSPFGG